MPDDEFMRQRRRPGRRSRRGEDMVDLAGAFDEALGGGEEWKPGQNKDKDKRRNPRDDEDEE